MKLLTFRRLKMKPVAENKNFAPPSKNTMNTDEQAADRASGRDQRFDHLCLGLGDMQAGISLQKTGIVLSVQKFLEVQNQITKERAVSLVVL
jgi:hypothetical protein